MFCEQLFWQLTWVFAVVSVVDRKRKTNFYKQKVESLLRMNPFPLCSLSSYLSDIHQSTDDAQLLYMGNQPLKEAEKE